MLDSLTPIMHWCLIGLIGCFLTLALFLEYQKGKKLDRILDYIEQEQTINTTTTTIQGIKYAINTNSQALTNNLPEQLSVQVF